MPEVAMKDVLLPWNCRWVRLASHVVGFPELEQAGGRWVCVRPRRGRLTVHCGPPHVTERECAECEFWETDDLPKV
jgi:hypothetical protein